MPGPAHTWAFLYGLRGEIHPEADLMETRHRAYQRWREDDFCPRCGELMFDQPRKSLCYHELLEEFA